MSNTANVLNIGVTMVSGIVILIAIRHSDCHLACAVGHFFYTCIPLMQVIASLQSTRVVLLTSSLLVLVYPFIFFLCMFQHCNSATMAVSTISVAAIGLMWTFHYYYIILQETMENRKAPFEIESNHIDDIELPPPSYTTTISNNSTPGERRVDLDMSNPTGYHLNGAPLHCEVRLCLEPNHSNLSDSIALPYQPCYTRAPLKRDLDMASSTHCKPPVYF